MTASFTSLLPACCFNGKSFWKNLWACRVIFFFPLPYNLFFFNTPSGDGIITFHALINLCYCQTLREEEEKLLRKIPTPQKSTFTSQSCINLVAVIISCTMFVTLLCISLRLALPGDIGHATLGLLFSRCYSELIIVSGQVVIHKSMLLQHGSRQYPRLAGF